MDDITNEEWKPIVGYEGRYEVSSHGRVRSFYHRFGKRKSPRIVVSHPNGEGYLSLRLYKDGKAITHRVHRLVLLAFIGKPPIGFEACHNDGEESNNRLENLRWDTPSSNCFDKTKHGTHPDRRGKLHPQAKLTEDDVRCIKAEPYYIGVNRMLANAFGVSSVNIRKIRNRETWTHL